MRAAFLQRARHYARVDRQLGHKTRFFAAAAVTNQVLGWLAPLHLAVGTSAFTIQELASMGSALERINRHYAGVILDAPPVAGDGLEAVDVETIGGEQRELQGVLDAFKQRAPVQYELFIRELGALMNRPPWPVLRYLHPLVFGYQQVLAAVRARLRARLDFSNQQHREAIGFALIDNIRAVHGRAARLPGHPHQLLEEHAS
jgi:hypothetical protein